MGLTLLSHAQMPLKFRVKAFQTTVHLINWLPASPIKFNTPFELLYRKLPNYQLLQPFGYACFPYLRPYNKHKFNFHSTKCLFIGYTQVGYKCMHPSGRVCVSRNVKFNDNEFPFLTLFSISSVTPKIMSSSLGCSTEFLQSIVTYPTSSKCSQVSQSCCGSSNLSNSM